MQFCKLTLLLALLFLPGCDGGASYDTPGNPRPAVTNNDRIAGVWRVRSYSTPSGGLQQCPSTTAAFSCTANTVWSFQSSGSMQDANNVTRAFTFDGTNLTYFGKPAGFTITVTQLTPTLMSWDMNGVAGVNETVSVLFEKQ